VNKKQLRALLLSIVLSSAAYGLWVGLSDPTKIGNALNKIGIQGCIVLLALSLVNYLLRFARYHWMMKHIGDKVPTLPNLLYYLSGFALTTTPGKAGESIRYIYLKPYKVPFKHAIAILLTERLLDLLAVWFIALLGIWTFEEYRWVIILTAVICTVAIILIQQPLTIKVLNHYAKKSEGKLIGKICHFGAETCERTKELLAAKPLLIGCALGIMSWGAEAIGFVYLIDLLGYDLNGYMVAAIYSAAMLVGALSFLPGGLGGAEITMHLLLMALSVSDADSVAATLICRIATLWFAVLIGILVMCYLEVVSSHAPKKTETDHSDATV
tara:strand:- start:32306 stop:33286 length:981 start_codon:yes stop_codon:yes gene_type:complete